MDETVCHDMVDVENDGKGGSTYGERALWRAVITQALMDAGKCPVTTQDKVEKARAIAWLAGRSKDFETVCAFADYDPRYVVQRAREAIKRDCKWRRPVKEKKGKTQEGAVVAVEVMSGGGG